jgi:hypothetical protein
LDEISLRYELLQDGVEITSNPKVHNTNGDNYAPPLKIIIPGFQTPQQSIVNVEFDVEFQLSLNKRINNNVTQGIILTILITSMIAQISSTLNYRCFNFGNGFIKFFLIIEIMGAFLFLPVRFNQDLRDVLFSIHQLGEVVQLRSSFLVQSRTQDQAEQNRYWGKLSQYGVDKNILQGALFQAGTVIILSTLQFSIKLAIKLFFRKSKTKNRFKTVLDKLYMLTYAANVISYQGALVDIVFAATFNLQGCLDFKPSDPHFYPGKISSFVALSILITFFLY